MENLHHPAQMYVNLIALVAVAALGIGSPASLVRLKRYRT